MMVLLLPLQGPSSLWSTGLAGPPSPLLAGISIAWLTLTKLINRNISSPVSTAAAQMHACCTSSDPVSAVAAVQLLPIMCLMQHGCFEEARAPADAVTAGQQRNNSLQQRQQQCLTLYLSKEGYQQCIHGLLGSLPNCTGKAAAALQLSGVQAVSQILQVATGAVDAVQVAAWLQESIAVVMRIQQLDFKRSIVSVCGDSAAAAGGQEAKLLNLLSSCEPPVSSSITCDTVNSSELLPPLKDLDPILKPLAYVNSSDSSAVVQCAILHLLNSYLAAVKDPEQLSGSRQYLLNALQLLTSINSGVRDAALELVQQYLKPLVLQEAFAVQEQQHGRQLDESDVPGNPQGRLLHYLQQLSVQLPAVSEAAGSKQQLTGVTRAPDSVVAAKTSLLRAVAGLYGGLIGSGCEHLPLLYLLEQQCPALCPDDRVSVFKKAALQWLCIPAFRSNVAAHVLT